MTLDSRNWLRSTTTVEQFEASALWTEALRKSFGQESAPYMTLEYAQLIIKRWEQFKSEIAPGDELWSYSGGMGNQGIVIMRDEEIIADFVIMER